MKPQTSVEAYHQIKKDGTLAGFQLAVYECILNHGPINIKGASKILNHIPATTVSTRFSELERFGVLEWVEEKPCSITGRKSNFWKISNNLPSKPKRKEKKEKCFFVVALD